MLRSLNLLPPTLPTLQPDGSGLCQGPRHVLQRVVDAGGTSAAWACWSLWNEFQEPRRRFEIPVCALQGDPLDDAACQLFKVSRAAPHEADGAGYLLFPDLSVLVVRQAEGCAWSRPTVRNTLEVLPVVFRISPIIHTKYGTLRLQVVQSEAGLSISFAKPFDDKDLDAPKMIRHHIDREVAAWAAWIPRTPLIERPSDTTAKGTDWPAFFPMPYAWLPETIFDFEHDTLRAVQSVIAWVPDSIQQAQVSAWSARPLQGGVEPMKLAINWDFKQGGRPYHTDSLNAHVHDLVFGLNTPWSMDDFLGLKLYNYGVGSSYSSNIELFTMVVPQPPSHHARLDLTGAYAAPPPPPALPGEPGYGLGSVQGAVCP